MSLTSKHKNVCCVPSCNLADINAEKHTFTWEVICDSIGIASVDSPEDISLHYQQVYRMIMLLVHVSPVVC